MPPKIIGTKSNSLCGLYFFLQKLKIIRTLYNTKHIYLTEKILTKNFYKSPLTFLRFPKSFIPLYWGHNIILFLFHNEIISFLISVCPRVFCCWWCDIVDCRFDDLRICFIFGWIYVIIRFYYYLYRMSPGDLAVVFRGAEFWGFGFWNDARNWDQAERNNIEAFDASWLAWP